MEWQNKGILLLASVLALLAGVRHVQHLHAAAPASAQWADPGAVAWVEPNPTPGSKAGEVDQVSAFESSQAQQAAPSATGPISGLVTKGTPSAEERHAILDMVNRGPPILSDDDGQAGEGPVPGTESVMGRGEGQDDILDGVNRGAPLLPEGDKEAGEGPAPGTESDMGYGEARDDVLGRVNRGAPELPGNDDSANEGPEPGSESDTEQRFSLGQIWTRFVQTLRNWWNDLRA